MSTRRLVLAGAGLVGAATAATSAVSLYSLAMVCGIPTVLAAALPIALDVGAGVAALVWITERGELRRWGQGIALAALVATLAGNAVQHAIEVKLVEVKLPLVLAVGACIPAMLFAVVHIAALLARPAVPAHTRRDRPVVVGPRRSPARPAMATPSGGPVEPPANASVGKRAAGIAWARREWPCTGRSIALAVGVSRAEGDRIRVIVRDELKAVAS